MTVLLKGRATGSNFSAHDALYAYPADMLTTGTLAPNTSADTGLSRINFADATTQRAKWVWAIPLDWVAGRVNIGVINENAGTGNVRWQLTYKHINLGEGDVDGAVTNTITITLSSGNQFDWTYHQVTASLSTPSGGLGDKPFTLFSLSRLGADGADTLAGVISLGVATMTRVDV